ncbi:MAG: hypothetical protein IKH25_11940 [Muribaculaceae bacterium]|jgi:hypothetical protein|nr:hypothetical protein [Muribaculaceae bacterium]
MQATSMLIGARAPIPKFLLTRHLEEDYHHAEITKTVSHISSLKTNKSLVLLKISKKYSRKIWIIDNNPLPLAPK